MPKYNINLIYLTPIKNYTKNQAKTLIYGFCADFLSIVLLVFSIKNSCEIIGLIFSKFKMVFSIKGYIIKRHPCFQRLLSDENRGVFVVF